MRRLVDRMNLALRFSNFRVSGKRLVPACGRSVEWAADQTFPGSIMSCLGKISAPTLRSASLPAPELKCDVMNVDKGSASPELGPLGKIYKCPVRCVSRRIRLLI